MKTLPSAREALGRIRASAVEAARLATAQRSDSDGQARVTRRWWPEAGCHLMMMHQRLDATLDDLRALSAIFYGAAQLRSQPWYAQFRMGASAPVDAVHDGLLRVCRAVSTVDLGFGTPRAYPVLCAEVALDPSTRVVALNAIHDPPRCPERAVPVVLAPPSGDVFHHDGGALHWHHVIVTPGIGLGPRWFDHGLLRMLRAFGLDHAEQAVMRAEGEGLARFAAETNLTAWCEAQGLAIR
ncbi:MAG: hypothetical protein AAF602_00335 [Myxococcota bacterium]